MDENGGEHMQEKMALQRHATKVAEILDVANEEIHGECLSN